MLIHLFDTNLLPGKEELINHAVLKYWLFCSCAFWRNASQTNAFCIMTVFFEEECFGTKIMIFNIHCPLFILLRVIFHVP